MQRMALQIHLDTLLDVSRWRDYCPNGLQVEGREQIKRILCGVTASQALLDLAVAREADAILVHHGYFWKGEDSRITGIRRKRIATLLAHDINLFAYHLPLDGHPEFGNNAQLGKLFGWQREANFGEQELGWLGRLETVRTSGEIAKEVEEKLGRAPLLIGDSDRAVQRIAWCSGGAQGFFEQALLAGADLYLSGEISEQTVHLARESGVPYLAAGHHATERYGVLALAAYLRRGFGLEAEFVDLDNPV